MVKQVFTLTSNVRQVTRGLRAKTGLLASNLGHSALPKIAQEFVRRVRKNQFRPYSGRSGPSRLQTRTGLLRDSVLWDARPAGWLSQARMYSRTRYSAVQERGGTIKGKPWLSIPLRHTLDGSGQVQPQFRIIPGAHRTAAGTPTFVNRRGGSLIVSTRIGREVVGLRVLKTSVKIPAGRFGFMRTWNGMTKFRLRMLGQAARAAKNGRTL